MSLHPILEWVRSHANKLRRPGYEPGDILRSGSLQLFSGDSLAWEGQFSPAGSPPELPNTPGTYSLRVLDGSGALVFTDHEFTI